MNLQKLIDQLVDSLGFSDDEKKEISNDLIEAIATKFIVELSESGEDVSGLTKAIESKDQQEISNAFDNISKSPENSQILEKITVSTISNWTDSILPSIADDKQQKAFEILKNLKQE